MNIEDMMCNEGLEIGSVSVKWVRRSNSEKPIICIQRHEGNPVEKVKEIFHMHPATGRVKMVLTGHAAKGFFDLPYRSEPECIEKALEHFNLKPDILLSLGGENFTVFTLKDGQVKNIIPSSKCAAGTGEFVVQQFQRMGLKLENGIQESLKGNIVDLATRCSVHSKSDATHKLNKRECSCSDIARTLIDDLAKKAYKIVESSRWESKLILVIGGLTLNQPFVEHLYRLFNGSNLVILNESPYFEALGASLFASNLPDKESIVYGGVSFKKLKEPYSMMMPLQKAEKLLDYRIKDDRNSCKVSENASYIMGIDAGSTTTKAILFNQFTGSVDASCYLRTYGNPISAMKNCLNELIRQVNSKHINIVQIAVTGSGRELVSVYFGMCISFNEILAHARAAVQEVPDVDTVFEIGGQDSKYILFRNGIPVDYAMNNGCSAGTGSFLEESVSVDMGIAVEDISKMAENSLHPVYFGERCAAFINTDLRSALQQGAPQDDVIAGLVYSIIQNYISRIVGAKTVGDKLLFQGGVALNRSVALAVAALTQHKVVVPEYPELMGCVGSCLMAQDMIDEGRLSLNSYDLKELINNDMKVNRIFKCNACENKCEIKMIDVSGKEIPFGGLCSKYEVNRKRSQIKVDGQDMIAIRNKMMFEEYGPKALHNPLGTIGIPLALTTYEFYPLFAKLINELGFNVVLSGIANEGKSKTIEPACYPAEIAHGAVYDLIKKNIDYIFLPHIIDGDNSSYGEKSLICNNTRVVPDMIRMALNIDGNKILQPIIGFNEISKNLSLKQIVKLGCKLGINRNDALHAGRSAYAHYYAYKNQINQLVKKNMNEVFSKPTVILAGRPYIICSSEANLALPQKITARGYNVISSDMLLQLESTMRYPGNIWYYTQQNSNAITYSKQFSSAYICLLSCFSCVADAMMLHIYQHELENKVFCYLEIDSHTAHVGFDTRLGAYLDIIELTEHKRSQNKLI